MNSVASSAFGNPWNPSGNNVGSVQKLGTTSNFDLPFITNNTEKMRLSAGGNLGIGTTSPASKLDVSGSYKLGSAGTVLNSMIKTTVTVGDATTFNNQQTKTYTAAITGASVTATVFVTPGSALPAGMSIAWSRISSADVVTIAFTNSDPVAKSLGSVTYDVTIIQ